MPEPQQPRRVLRFVREQPWAILPSALDTMLDVLELRAAGERYTADEIAARLEAARRPGATVVAPGAIAVLNLFGIMSPRIGMLDEMSGGTSTEAYGAAFRAAVDDPNVAAIVLNIDSPGGSVYGVEELADTIDAARGTKPVVAIANPMAASAAYWIASQADELVVTPSGEVGSIGVIMAHDDLSGMAEQLGVKRTYLTHGRYKAEGNPYEGLAAETVKYYQGRLDEYGAAFEKGVGRGRGIAASKVAKDFFEGRLASASQAVAAGMADREGTLQDVVSRLVKKQGKGARAEGEAPPVMAGTEEAPAVEIDPRVAAMARLRLAGARRAS